MPIGSRRNSKKAALLLVVTWWFLWNGQVGPFTTSDACIKVVQAFFLGSDCETFVANVCFSNTGLIVQVPQPSCPDAGAGQQRDAIGHRN